MDARQTTLDEVRARVRAAMGKGRPRLMRRPGDTDALFARLASDLDAAAGYAALLAAAGELAETPLLERVMTGRRLLDVSRECLSRVVALAQAWRLTGDRRHADRAAAEARQVCSFSDWNPSHFLDTAEMSLAVALALDWLHDALPEEVRAELAAGLVSKGLAAGDADPDAGWIRATNNWGQVCHCGMAAAALATMELDPERTARVVHRAVTHVPLAMAAYAPDGGYPEGPGYWNYGTMFNVMLIDLLESALGTDFGLSRQAGFDRTALYIQQVKGPTGQFFNYADGGESSHYPTALYWLAARFGTPLDPSWPANTAARWKQAAAGPGGRGERFALELLWLPPAGGPPASSGPLPLDWRDGGAVPVAVHRSGWGEPRALFAGIKAGSPSHAHGQMDSGSFVLDADGVRWAVDLGAEDYHRIESRGMNLWARDQDSDRWRVFRLTNHSHNTLTIDGALQTAAGAAPITDFRADPDTPWTEVDLSSVYQGQAARVTRRLALPGRAAAVVTDCLDGLRPGARVRWGFVTRAEVRPAGACAELRQAGATLRLEAAGGEWTWRVADTETPRAEHDSPNPGTRMVCFEAVAPASGSLRLEVRMTPGVATGRG